MKSILVLFFIFFIGFIDAATISMSPPQINFIGSVGEQICTKFFIETDAPYMLVGEDKWAIEGYSERKLSKHILNNSEIDLEVQYIKIFQIGGRSQIKICIRGEHPGNFHGILLYGIKNKSIKVGIWMNVSLEESNKHMSHLTGKIIENEKVVFENLLFLTPIFLFLILMILRIISKNNLNLNLKKFIKFFKS